MSRYGQYNNYYDPAGSQSHQPSGYTYQQSSTSASAFPSVAASSGYGSSYQQSYGGHTYSNQQYAAGATQQPNHSASHAAAALSSLSGHDYSQTSSANRSNQYSGSNWYNPGSTSNTYSASNMGPPNRSQNNNSPPYASAQSSSTFGRLSVPDQTQSGSNTFNAGSYQSTQASAGTSNRSYQTGHQQTQNPPQRYNSPLHAMRAQQQGHGKQSSRGSNNQPSPQMPQAVRAQQSASRQESASVEPSPTTVDPSQVYDNRAELERKARIEAEKRKKYEAEQAAIRAEEEKRAAEQRKAEEEKQKAEKEAEMKKAEQQRKNEQRRKAREEKKQSKTAATALTQLASGGGESSAAPPANDEEAEMREMFKKMREFNSKNPAMLAKLWEEERRSHAESQSESPQAEKATPKAPAQQKASSATPATTSKAANKPAQQNKPASPESATAAAATNQKAQQMASTQQSRPVSGQANTSLWPPHKKGSLAEATANWLMSLPQNAGKQISPEVVLNILNSNPSYVQLCESLEGFGLRFERSTLARELLKAVPDGLKAPTTQKPSTPTTNGTAQAMHPPSGSPDTSKKKGKSKGDATHAVGTSSGTVNYEAPISLADAAREVNSMGSASFQPPSAYNTTPQQPQQSPYFSQSQNLTNGSRLPSQHQSQSQLPEPEIKEEFKSMEPPRPPADKEEAARKRTFGDLVDLTAEDSDDDQPPPKKIAQPTSGPVNGMPPQQQGQRPTFQHPASFKHFMYQPPGQGAMYPPRPQPGQMSLPSYITHPHGAPPQPQQPPPVPSQPKMKGPTPEQQQTARMKGKMLVEPIMRDRVARKSKYDSKTIARDILLATGRHPDMRGLNAHLTPMQKLLGQHGAEFDSEGKGNKSDLSTIRWDVIDPEQPKQAEVKKDEPVDQATMNAKDAHDTPNASRPTSRDHMQPDNSIVNYKYPSAPRSSETKQPKRRGRPPKSATRNSMPDSIALTNPLGNEAESSTPRPTSQTSRPATPSSAPTANMATGASIGYSAFDQLGPDGKKKRGRPFGWKKSLHSREAQGLPPKSLPGRPKQAQAPQSTSSAKVEVVKQPEYQVYRCDWAGCGAELHNLETLKKHVVKVHGKARPDGVFECLWEGCRSKGFEGIEAWVSHVDKVHLEPVAWRLGDGPRGGVASDTWHEAEYTPAYLSDSHGRSVTPIITPATRPSPSNTTASQPGPSSTIPAPAPPSQPPAPKGRGRPPKDPSGLSKAQRDIGAPLRKLQEHKRAVGPTMERMGCVLVDEERRGTFLDDEDFEDVVYASEGDPDD